VANRVAAGLLVAVAIDTVGKVAAATAILGKLLAVSTDVLLVVDTPTGTSGAENAKVFLLS
jgi:hypothetical protein